MFDKEFKEMIALLKKVLEQMEEINSNLENLAELLQDKDE